MRTIPGRSVARAVLGAVLLLSCILTSTLPASAAGYPRRIAIAPFVSLAKEDNGAPVTVIPRIMPTRLMAMAGAEVKVNFEILRRANGKLCCAGYFEYTLINLKTGRAEPIPEAIATMYAV